jgi:hypothetical protein
MVTLAELLQAVADQIQTAIADVTDVTVHVEPGLFRSAEMPSINVYPTARVLTQDFAGFNDLYGGWPMTVRVAVSPADIEAGESLLWEFMDEAAPLSIIAALDSDHSLGGIADDLVWGDWAGYLDFSPPDEAGRYVGSTLPLLVAKAHS